MFCLVQNQKLGQGRLVPPTPDGTHALCGTVAMARPKLPITRDRQFNVSLTAAEFDAMQRAARMAGLRPVDFARAKILSKTRRSARTTHDVRQFEPVVLVALSRIGNNLNQIARSLNELSLDVPDDLAPLLAELRGILRMAAAP